MSASKHANPKHALRDEREHRGWSREHVANLLGTNPFTIYRWESGRAFPNRYYRQRLSEVFGCGLEQLGLLPASKRTPLFLNITSTREGEGAVPFPASWPCSSGVPQPLVGRESWLERLKQQMSERHPTRSVCLALHGLPGVGKTALAAALASAEEVRQRFCDGIVWIELGSHPEMLSVLSRWAEALGLPSRSREPGPTGSSDGLKQALHTAMSRRSMLIVIDDVWSVEESFELHLGGSDCAYLLTTRFPLLAAQYAPHANFALPELPPCAGLALLERLAPAAVQLEPERVQDLVSAVGGLPLALAVIGNYLYLQGTSGQPRRIRTAIGQLQQRKERLTLLQGPSGIGGTISLQTTIAASVARLSAPAVGLLQRLAGFSPKPCTFSEQEAYASSQMGDTLFFRCLDELCDAGLLESSAPERYTLHPTIVDYILEYGERHHAPVCESMLSAGIVLIPQS